MRMVAAPFYILSWLNPDTVYRYVRILIKYIIWMISVSMLSIAWAQDTSTQILYDYFLPNRLLIVVEGGEKSGVDGRT